MIKKTAFMYLFKSADKAEEFLAQANAHFASAYAQHPQTNGKPDKLRVLVTGSGSITHDIALRDYLDKAATKCDGEYEIKK